MEGLGNHGKTAQGRSTLKQLSRVTVTVSQTENQTAKPLTTFVDSSASVKTDLFYSFGTLGRSTIGFVVSSWLLYFYIPPGGEPLVPVALYGFAIIFGQIISAILAPLIGYLSDNCKSRWGRRLPFMFIAGLPVILLFVLLWIPPVQKTSTWNLLFLALVFGLFRVALGFYQVPYKSVLPEIAITEKHRVRISAYQSGFLLVGMVIGGMAGLTIENLGYGVTALIYAGIGLIAFYIPIAALRGRKAWKYSSGARIDFRQSLSITMKNRVFMLFTLVWAIYMMTTSLIQSSAPFIVTEICRLNKADTIYFYLPGLIASLASYPLISKLTNRLGKEKVFAGSFLLAALVFPGTMLIGQWLTISLKTQCISWAVLQAVSISGMVVLTTAFIAEITDYDHAVTGQHREGMYYATLSVLEQISTGIASVLLPVLMLLGRSHLSPQGPLGIRLTGLIGGALMFIGFIIFLRFPLRHNLSEDHLKS